MKSNYDVALEVLAGKWGNGVERRNRLQQAGYDYSSVQSIVNTLVEDGYLNTQIPQPEAEEPEPQKNLLEIDYDPQTHDGIVVNIIV